MPVAVTTRRGGRVARREPFRTGAALEHAQKLLEEHKAARAHIKNVSTLCRRTSIACFYAQGNYRAPSNADPSGVTN